MTSFAFKDTRNRFDDDRRQRKKNKMLKVEFRGVQVWLLQQVSEANMSNTNYIKLLSFSLKLLRLDFNFLQSLSLNYLQVFLYLHLESAPFLFLQMEWIWLESNFYSIYK